MKKPTDIKTTNPTAKYELVACDFPQSNFTYTAPAEMPNCYDLPTYRGEGVAVSCWKLTLRQRLRLLLTGKLFLWVVMNGHPPVCLTTLNPLGSLPGKGGAK
jgi:hypothetical protein